MKFIGHLCKLYGNGFESEGNFIGSLVKMRWKPTLKFVGNVVEMRWNFSRNSIKIQWKFDGSLLEFVWKLNRNSSGNQRKARKFHGEGYQF